MDSLAQSLLWLLWETHPDVDPVPAGFASALPLAPEPGRRAPEVPMGGVLLRIGPLAIAAGAIVLGSGLGSPALANEHLCVGGKRESASNSEHRWGSTVRVDTPDGYALNVRWGPGTNNSVQRCVLRGSTLQLSGKEHNGWVQLTDETWVARRWVSRSTTIPSTCNGGKQATVVIPQNVALSIRNGPGFSFPIVGQFVNGTCIAMTGQFYVGWAQLNDGTWVDSSRIQYSGPITNVTQPPLDDVMGLQLRLRQAGFLPINFVLSGIYDQATQNAVREFQQVNRLPATGIADAATWNALSRSIDNVKELQQLLRQAGFLPANFVLSGIYDAATESAVREFQRVTGLPVTGTIDTATWNALPRPLSDVKKLQQLLRQAGFLSANFAISGIYDQTTQNAVREFQRVNGLPVTGIVDDATWQALYRVTTPTPLPSPSPNPSPGPTNPPPSGTSQRRVATDGDSASVFKGPGAEFGFVRGIPNGSIVTITGRISGNWSELLEGNWIFSLDLEPI